MHAAPVRIEPVRVGIGTMPCPFRMSYTRGAQTVHAVSGQIELHPISSAASKETRVLRIFHHEIVHEFRTHFVSALVFSSGEITALHVENGGFAWSDSLSSTQKFGGIGSLTDIKALPVIDKGLLIAMNFSGRMAAIDIRSGGRIWERDIGSSNTPWIAGEVIYVLSADNNLMALNRQTGLIHWITGQDNYENADKRKNPINWQGPILVNGRLITVGSHGITKEHSATTGEFLREWKTSKNISITPIVAGQTLYLLSEKGTLYAYK